MISLLAVCFGCALAAVFAAFLVQKHRAEQATRVTERRRGWFEAFRPERRGDDGAERTPSGTLFSRR